MRPLEKLPTIRAKLGSTIVFAVGMTIVLVYFLLGFALRNAFREADLGRLARVAARAAASDLSDIPDGVTVVHLREGTFTWYGPEATPPPTFHDGRVHIGVAGGMIVTRPGRLSWFQLRPTRTGTEAAPAVW